MAIEWVPATGGSSVTVTLTKPTITELSPASPYKKRVARGTASSGTLLTWDLSYRIVGETTWTSYAQGIPAATLYRDLIDLSPDTEYEFQTVGNVTVPYTTAPTVGTGTTDPAPVVPPSGSRTFQLSPYIEARYANGMLNGVGSSPSEGAIPAQGRTWNGSLPGSVIPGYALPGVDWAASRTPHNILGIRFKLNNLNSTPISGGKLLVGVQKGSPVTGFALAGASTPGIVPAYDGAPATEYNDLNDDPTLGWATAKIGNDSALPVPADNTTTLGAKWTDVINFPEPIAVGAIKVGCAVPWRFFRPQAASSDYALTLGSWGPEEVNKQGTLTGAWGMYKADWQFAGDFGWEYYYADGDHVTNPAGSPWASVFSANKSPDALLKYGPPGPTHEPFDHIQYKIATPIPQILEVGDSITEGFRDYNKIISCMGVPGRELRKTLQVGGEPTKNHINLGQSGFTIPQYLKRMRGFIEADPTAVSICVISVYTPNIISGETFDYAWRPSTLEANEAEIDAAVAYLLSKNIVPMLQLLGVSPLGDDGTLGPNILAFMNRMSIKYPYIMDLSPATNNPASTTGPVGSTVWFVDATHPSGPDAGSDDPELSGYERIRQYRATLWDAKLAQSKSTNGFTA